MPLQVGESPSKDRKRRAGYSTRQGPSPSQRFPLWSRRRRSGRGDRRSGIGDAPIRILLSTSAASDAVSQLVSAQWLGYWEAQELAAQYPVIQQFIGQHQQNRIHILDGDRR